MRVTNKTGLPAAIVEAVKNDAYNAGDCDISCTTLIGPARKAALTRSHHDELTEDASDRIWALFGQAMHTILERAERTAVVEERLYAECGGWIISGQSDRYEPPTGLLQDFKTTSVWSVKGDEPKPDWVAQLNVLAWLQRINGREVKRLEIVAILRDWSRNKARFERDYPNANCVVVPVPLWSMDKQQAYVAGRVLTHQAARGGNLPECTAEERWERPTKYAAKKEGRKSALRVCESLEDLQQWGVFKGLYDAEAGEWAAKHSVEVRVGDCIRCADYCAVSHLCEQWQSIKEARA